MGSKPKGEGDRMRPLGDTGEIDCDIDCCSVCAGAGLGEEDGDNERIWLMGSSLREDGEASSGLAIRSPPRDCDKFKSPFMMDRKG